MDPGGIEAIGDAVTGALAGRALEPGAGEPAGAREGACLNCGAALAGPYCHQCGQAARVHRNLAAFGHDLAHGVFHIEGKIWRTLPLLAWRPGELTRRYIDGQRARFVSPMALFLFSVFLMVAVFHAVGVPVRPHAQTIRNGKLLDAGQLAAELARAERKVSALETARAGLAAQKADTAAIDRQLEDAKGDRDGLRTGAELAAGVDPGRIAARLDLKTGMSRIDRSAERMRGNPELAAYQLQSNAYKFSWALIPISLPFIWLMFAWRRDVTMFDHAVFATYSLSAMTLLAVVLSLLAATGVPGVGLGLLLLPPIHMYRQLRGTYRLSRFGTLWRTFMLLVFALISAILFFVLLVALGAMG
jgi:hypothetical protein